jgi:hypothetical protein
MAFSEADFPEVVNPPYEAHFYWPTGEDVVVGTAKKAERLIFSRQDYLEYENYKLEKLEAFIRTKGLQGFSMPSNYDRSDLLRFLHGCGFVTKKTYNAFINHLKWRATFLPPDYRLLIGRLRGLLEEGVFYIHGRDNRYRPCVIMDISKVDMKRYESEDYCYLLCFVLTYVVEAMMLPGQIENWVVISDFANKGLLGLPIRGIKRIVTTLLENFRCRLGLNYILNAPSTLAFMWSIVNALLDKRTSSKITTLAASSSPKMLSHFAPHQVEQKFGGTAPNLTSFWPPCMPPPPYNAPGDEQYALLTNFTPYVPPEPERVEVYSASSSSESSVTEDEESERATYGRYLEVSRAEEEAYEAASGRSAVGNSGDMEHEANTDRAAGDIKGSFSDQEVAVKTEPMLVALIRKNSAKPKRAGRNVFKPESVQSTWSRPVQLLSVQKTEVTTQFQTANCNCVGNQSMCSLL